MTILVIGKTGQVARELQLCGEVESLSREELDLSRPSECAKKIRALSPSAVINAAAYTAVDQAEGDEQLAMVVNGDAPTAMAQACADLDIPMIHISTDYIFDGQGQAPWSPQDPPTPMNAYGRTKLAGEIGVRAAGGRYAILRTSWVFSAHGKNFLKTMVKLSETRDRLSVVADQIGGPTPASSIARACLQMAEQLRTSPSKVGTYHFSGAPDVSWADFARTIMEFANPTVTVDDISTSEYPTPAKRPLDSRLDCSSTQVTFGIRRPDWRAEAQGIVQELKNKDVA